MSLLQVPAPPEETPRSCCLETMADYEPESFGAEKAEPPAQESEQPAEKWHEAVDCSGVLLLKASFLLEVQVVE